MGVGKYGGFRGHEKLVFIFHVDFWSHRERLVYTIDNLETKYTVKEIVADIKKQSESGLYSAHGYIYKEYDYRISPYKIGGDYYKDDDRLNYGDFYIFRV